MKNKNISNPSAGKTAEGANNLKLVEDVSQDAATSLPAYQVAVADEYMGQEQMKHFRQRLMTWRLRLIQGASQMQEEASDDNNIADESDRASREEQFAISLRTRDRDRKLVPKIDEALVRIEAGNFGYCEQCDLDIGLQRLEARPTTELCIDCKTIQEMRERQGITRTG